MKTEQFDLKELLNYFTEVGQVLQNMPLRLELLEKELEEVRTGKAEFSLKHIKVIKDEEEKYWRFPQWWKIPEIEEKDLIPLKGVFIQLQPIDKPVIEKLFSIIKNVEIVSCILRFISPKDYGILSVPVEDLLNIRGKSPINKYINYLNDLEQLKKEYRFKRIADVDMALWTLANILNRPELRTYPKYQALYEKYKERTNLVKIIMARNSLDQIWDEKGYLFIAELFLDTDHEIAGIIAGREMERFVQRQCKKHEIIRESKTPPPKLSEKLLEKRCISYKEHKNIKEWWDLRNALIHKFGVRITKDRVENMIDGMIDFIEKYKTKSIKK